MRKGLPQGLGRRNLTLPGREAASLDFLRVETEASSDSEVTRQALRHFEQLVEDEKHGITLRMQSGTGELALSSKQFQDRPEDAKGQLVRRSIILHEQSEKRLQKLRAEIDAHDVSEVVRSALRFYETIIRAAVDGTKFFVRLPSGEEYRVRFGSFARAETNPDPTPATRLQSQSEPPGQEGSGGSSSISEPARVLARAQNR
jgi:Arc/MetJ-type ribon-helix-helix transcriptional regulator